MKRILLFAAVAGAALASCVKNESESGMTASDSKISFEAPVVGATTRAVTKYGEIVGTYPTEEDFKVWGWYHEGDYTTFGDTENGWKNYMTASAAGDPVVVEYDGTSSWDSATDYFWPKNGKLTFAAYSPADAAGTYSHSANGLQITDFTVAAVGAQYDLMYSDRAYNRTSSTNQYGGTASNTYTGVDIVFHHALSSIVFKAGTDDNYTTANNTFKIKSITIKNVANAGNFNEGLTDGNGSTTRTPAWAVTGTVDKEYVAFSGDFTVPADGSTRQEPTGAADLILLPQSFATNNSAIVEIKYTYGTAASGEIQHTETFQLNHATNVQAWEPNKRYTYNIIFGLDKIYFAPVVEAWDDVNVGDIEL